MPKYSAPVAVADVLVVFGTATMNSAAVGNGIGNVAVRDEQYPHCLTVADCNPCGASQIHIGVIKSGSSGRELTQEIMIIVTIVRTVSIAKNSPYRIERYRECYIVFANTISPLWLCSYCNVSPTQNVVWSYTRYSSQCCIGAIAIPSTSS